MSFGDYHDFEVPYANDEVAWIKERVRAYRWFDQPEDAGWRYGANQDYLKRLQRYWLDQYSWRRAVTQINAFPHYRVDMGGGFHLHCIHRRSPDVNAIPLLISHGWPGSVLEFTHLIERLAEPEEADMPAFHVIAPSLPGYAWSDKPKSPMGPRAVGKLYDRLMEALGYPAYLAQGGDWGCVISGWIGLDSERCRALHLNGFGLTPHDMSPQSDEEKAWLEHAVKVREAESAYMLLQGTKPQSLGFAMMDSPMGVAAWLAEKYCTWGDKTTNVEAVAHHLPAPDVDDEAAFADEPSYAAPPPILDGDPPFSMEWLLTNIMIYLTTRSFNSSTWIYSGMFAEGGFSMPAGARVEKPVAAASYPKDLLVFPPHTLAKRGYNIVRWTDMPRGGHFPSVEEPELFLSDLREFARDMQDGGTL